MPVYIYRRDDGTTFDYRQKFSDDALKVDPVTGQHVIRVVQAAGVIFKGSGFYVNDSKSASRSSVNNTASHNAEAHNAEAHSAETHSAEHKSEKAESAPSADRQAEKTEKASKVESKTATERPAAAKPQASAAAD